MCKKKKKKKKEREGTNEKNQNGTAINHIEKGKQQMIRVGVRPEMKDMTTKSQSSQ